ncbi:biopolymer transporter Tol [Agreia sp. PsM10]|uniref:biopolymer transporter Tol n=1 Tax=Agreia sp. PsM10 TaxID=3030533 RepID=UPI00263B8BED|nr:biopolymer transporter Tol [Agreia sp. PsM10]MDN4640750.1 biopolymer transporter Tol [Agreia sp. PsM10]
MSETGSVDDDRWLVINGRKWRRTDPVLSETLVSRLKSHLGRGRSGVRAAKSAGDEAAVAAAVAAARTRVGLAKHGLGERGPLWWDSPEKDRIARANEALRQLDALDE